ncbi:MAG: [FeFe] hydrogenase H-cluster radical SAM maturase HydE [Bacteroidales bacterium]|nr:[FeFe] hydrogenase H-cluster radical SAM maturase HydE [Bacteroidales bacterium]MCL2133185.1 [FeFe] hydrogenase H-cluster radical SAM maturase HydE [Bacteroidales bacterium]
MYDQEKIIELLQTNPQKADITDLLNANEGQQKILLKTAADVKSKYVGNIVYFRGLVEYSNICGKNCKYCGIRKDNKKLCRYTMTDQEVIDAALYAHREKYASIAIQAGELNTEKFVGKITSLLERINAETNNELGITLSLGEQSEETLKMWKEKLGVRRYLLRIETSNRELYEKIHPNDEKHSYQQRLDTLKLLRKLNYQVGTGVMIGLPFQTVENLAEDILFFKNFDVDMIGMGPYIEHSDTPLYEYKDQLLPLAERYNLTLNMIAICRIMFKDINIVASTAMQAIDPKGREEAIMVGANIIMPNLTPQKFRENYLLYQNKPCLNEDAHHCKKCLEKRIRLTGNEIGYGEWGDAKHYFSRQFRKLK